MTSPTGEAPTHAAWREELRRIIFEADTPAGKAFDVVLLIAIMGSVLTVMLESVDTVKTDWAIELRVLEWFFTIVFTIEYAVRLVSVPRASAYAFSFWGVVDLLAVLPTYISLMIPGAHSLLVIRALRLLRIFRILKLRHFVGESDLLMTALRASRVKIIVFIGTVLIIVVIMGTLMHWIEGDESGFTSIPRGMYWAVVTMTTVGYGDITPQTVPGQICAAILMIMGYGIIAVPTGIVTSSLFEASRTSVTTRSCIGCMSEGHDFDALYCKDCGEPLP